VGRDPDTVGGITTDPPLPAGDFSSWMRELLGALDGASSSNVPCDGCTACCTSSQFVPIGPEETDTLAHIPGPLLFPAPGLPTGHVLMGYDERGHCPMLVDGACSIYEHRPITCRTYDCRVFPATGVVLDEGDKPRIAERAVRWRFAFPAERDRAEQDAAQTAARYLDEHPDVAPPTATRRAVLAVEIHDLFLGPTVPDPEVVSARVSAERGL
jgi:Fe-S-cluster containining protein